MYALALVVVGLSGYVSFSKVREGADPARSVGEGVVVAAMFSVLLSVATLWLSRLEASEVAEIALNILGLAFIAALLGAFSAGLKPRREPIAHW
jgi:hypothetical protein